MIFIENHFFWYFLIDISEVPKGIWKEIINKIEQKAKNLKIDFIRMDIVKANPFLEKYYSNLWYKKVTEKNIFETPSIFLEKDLK